MPIPKPKIIVFHVGVGVGEYASAGLAFAAAEAYRVTIVAAGDSWATSGWPGAGPLYHVPAEDPQSVGLYINKFTPTVPPPAGTTTDDFASADWIRQ